MLDCDHSTLRNLIWLAAKEEAALEEHLVSIGRRTAKERLVYLAIFLLERGIATGLVKKNVLSLSVTQAQIGDTLGLSLVHTNRTLQALRKQRLVVWSANSTKIPDMQLAYEYAHYEGQGNSIRP